MILSTFTLMTNDFSTRVRREKKRRRSIKWHYLENSLIVYLIKQHVVLVSMHIDKRKEMVPQNLMLVFCSQLVASIEQLFHHQFPLSLPSRKSNHQYSTTTRMRALSDRPLPSPCHRHYYHHCRCHVFFCTIGRGSIRRGFESGNGRFLLYTNER
jgi:hypothetical protein